MNKLFVFGFLVFALIACSKDKFKTEPQVEIKSLSPSEVRKGGFFSLNAVVRDKEGDLQDSVYLVRKRFNGTSLLTVDTIRYNINAFGIPNKTQLELQVIFSYGEIREGAIFTNLEGSDRNFAVGIIVRDKAGNKSQYVESDKIVLKRL
ncbi:MAG TPA: hypothetical protein VM368_04990 [Flavisolibacter sp.]|nr:hypothetical protein [Flavisolibacter sp.]